MVGRRAFFLVQSATTCHSAQPVMASSFYVEGEQRARKVNALFARIAPHYDLINDLQSLGLHRAWKRRMVQMARVRPGERALDVCCGTGDIAFALAEAGAHVRGVDSSDDMLAVALRRAQRRGRASAPEFVRQDAMALDCSDDAFDVVTVGYGLRNLRDWAQGLREMHRVAKPGGRLLVLEFGKPESGLWRAAYFGYLGTLVPLFGRVFYGDSQTHAYILESLRHYPAQKGVEQELRRLGCTNVRVVNLIGGAMSIHYAEKQAAVLPTG